MANMQQSNISMKEILLMERKMVKGYWETLLKNGSTEESFEITKWKVKEHTHGLMELFLLANFKIMKKKQES